MENKLKKQLEYKLENQIREAKKEGDFLLTGGEKSNFYVDIKSLLLKPLFLYNVAKEIIKEIEKIKTDPIFAIGGMELGSVPISTATCLASHHFVFDEFYLEQFIIRKCKRDHGTESQVEGWDNIRNKNVVVVDDVLTTGGSLKKAHNIIKNQANVVAMIVIFDRQDNIITEIDGVPVIALFKREELEK